MIPGGEPPLQRRVGAVALCVILAAAVFEVAIAPRLPAKGVVLEVDFAHVGGLQEGAPVMQAGRTVGRVTSITLAPGEGPVRTLVRLRVPRWALARIPLNADVFVSSKGFLSSRYLELGPPPGGAAPGRTVHAGDRLQGATPPSLDRAMQRTWDNLQRTRAFAEAVAPEARALRDAALALSVTLGQVEPRPGAYAELGLRLRALVVGVERLTDELAAAGAEPARLAALAGRARGLVADARAALATLDAAARPVVADVDRLGAAGVGLRERLAAAIAAGERSLAASDRLLASTEALLALVARGEGSAARLANDPEFPEDAKELGKLLKRQPWRVLGHPVGDGPPPAPP